MGILDPARYLADFARFTVTKSSQEQRDGEALRALQSRTVALPPGLELEWIGVSGYRLTYEATTIFIDPYVSRVPLGSILRGRPALPDQELVSRYLERPPRETVAGVLVGPTHFDHAVDSPAVIARYGCPGYGSSSLRALMAVHGLAERAVEVVPHQTYELGPFAVRFVPSLHSKLLLGLAVPMAGEFSCDHLDALSPRAYRCGQVFGIRIEVAGFSIYHQGSANLIDDEVPTGGVDLFLAGIAGRGFTAGYWERILRRLAPRTVVPTHFDDFFRPLDATMGFTTNVNLARIPDEVAAVSRDLEVAALPLLAPAASSGQPDR
jgi:L-ascorbate metabolism protein UlaG (beta-lactamase superfamily)